MIITTHPSENYLHFVSQIAREGNSDNMKIILPTVSACLKLQQIIVDESPNKACILPKIVPILNIGIESENIYQMSNSYLEPISRLEERIIITNIIMRQDSNIKIKEGLDLASHIIKLFDELVDANLDISELETKALSDTKEEIWHELAEHWQYRAGFLQRIYDEYTKIKKNICRIDFATYRQNMLKLEIEAAKIGKYRHIIAGFFPKGNIMNELTNIVGDSKDSYLILPPSDITISPKTQEILEETHHYYSISKYLDKVKIHNNQTSNNKKPPIEYMVADNSRIESELITNKITSWLDKNRDAKIALIIKNNELISSCTNILNQKNISHINLGGYDLSQSKIYEFFILLIEIYNEKGAINIEKLIALLKTKPLLSQASFEFELNLRKYGKAEHPIIEVIRSSKLSLKDHINLANNLYPEIWQSIEGKSLGDFLYSLLEIEEAKAFEGQDYVDFIKSISMDVKYHKNISNNNVFFTSLEEAAIGNYQYIICADMNENNMPSQVMLDPWMSPKMRDNLGLGNRFEKIGIEWSHFKNLLYRDNIFLTRSRKKYGLEVPASRFIQELISSGELNAAF